MKSLQLCLLLLACQLAFGQEKQSARAVAPFESVAIKGSGNATISIKDGKTHKLVINASPDDQSRIETTVRGNTLTIRFPDNYDDSDDVQIFIELPLLKDVSLSGGGNVTVENARTGTALEASISGGGNIAFKKASDVQHIVSSITGGGTIDARVVRSTSANATVTGGGKIILNVTSKLDGTVTGGGSIYYDGDPQVKSAVVGGGTIGPR